VRAWLDARLSAPTDDAGRVFPTRDRAGDPLTG